MSTLSGTLSAKSKKKKEKPKSDFALQKNSFNFLTETTFTTY